ncbi:carboxylesterase [Rhodococcoides trifolii]|uniref:Carboxylesterase n=1 Tax=Rhodococcoides trifolii TaxID=908250 RepID=A0A917FSS3_9NOCA|nr:alpha/beta fold hydrolase [Rhodococcus trifolii]GGG02095.1 carboxylesterase [Rhodococcus trifolii]
MNIVAGAEPFSADGGPVGFVVSHGFTGNPASVRGWAEHLAGAGFTVRAPRLPGHGTTWQDANTTTWHDWYGEIERAYDDLAARCDHVFAAGLSMGGTLVTRLAEQRQVAGLVLVNPAFATERVDAKLAKYIAWAVKSRPAIAGDIKKPGVVESAYSRTPVPAFVSLQELWAVTRADLGLLTCPVTLFRSIDDHVVEPLSGKLLIENATATTVSETLLTNSFHVATMDNDAQAIFDGTVAFANDALGR